MKVIRALLAVIITTIFLGTSSPALAQGLDAGFHPTPRPTAPHTTSIDPDRDAASAPNMTKISGNISVLNQAFGAGNRLNALTSPGLILSSLLPSLLVIAGLILFAMIIISGFGLLTAAGDAKKADAARGRLTTAAIGFIIIFAAYWITQILEIMLGVKILKQ